MSSTELEQTAQALEALLFAAGEPLSLDRLRALLGEERVTRQEIRAGIEILHGIYAARAVEIKEVASGFRFQLRQQYTEQVMKLWVDRAPKYSRALLETLAIIAYRQPVTRAEIEEIRGVGVSSTIMRTLVDRGWVKRIGQKELPGRPGVYGTAPAFLDHFNLSSLDELPPIQEVKELNQLDPQLMLVVNNVD
ncbi:MAG: SMC-Scp complex subunit ScpB [Gammaproteobacteria bacterium]|nr:SMC-Scp complex subunit ScpB [Gammaproteobacteria bacterium]